MTNCGLANTKATIDELYGRINHRRFVHPDPLEFLYDYPALADREVAGLIASSLAYGRVEQILKAVRFVLKKMPGPAHFLKTASAGRLARTYAGFKYRFTTAAELVAMLLGIKRAIRRHRSLEACFSAGLGNDDDTVASALEAFVEELGGDVGYNSLLPLPHRGSPCKRLNLFLRWMVRRDGVDPGGWRRVSASKLIVPLDTHMHRIAVMLGLTERRQADMKTALEITAAFRAVVPDDPVKYDFALTRLGIRKDMDIEALVGKGARYARENLGRRY